MSNDLQRLLHNLADEMTDTNYTSLRERVDRTSHRASRRHAIAVAAAGFVAVAALAGGGYTLATRHTPGSGPATIKPAPTATPTG